MSEAGSFSDAVLLSFDVTAPAALRSQATASLDALRQSEDGWRFCLEQFGAATEEPVKFWCLQTVVDMVVRDRRYVNLPEEQRQALRHALASWLEQKRSSQADEPGSIKNKFSQLLVAVLRHDYPQAWVEVFPLLLSTLPSGPVSIDLFLRVLNTINEDVVVNEDGNAYDAEVAARVKDGMREHCLPQLAEAWFSILTSLHESNPQLAAGCLRVVALYVPWIPIGLVANERWLNVLQPLLRMSRPLHEGACSVLQEVVTKRMDAQAKMEHLSRLRVVELLTADGFSNGAVAVSTPYASLAAALAMELLDCWDRLMAAAPPTPQSTMLANQAMEALGRTFPLVLVCLASDDLETSSATLAFLHSYVGRLRKLLPSPKELQQQEGALQQLLIVMGRRCVHPDDFDFEQPDEGEEEFNAYRRDLSTLFKGIARLHGSLAQEFVRSTLSTTIDALPSVPWSHLEVALWLLYTLGEGLPEAVIREKNGPFELLISSLLNSAASAYPHHTVQLLFFEIMVRYYRFFVAHPEFITPALATFLDERGLRNPSSPAVRSRSCYLLLRFVKQTLKSAQQALNLEQVVRPLLEALRHQTPDAEYTALLEAGGGAPPPAAAHANGHAHLNGGNGEHAPAGESPAAAPLLRLSDSEKLNVSETCGLLLGAHLAPPELVGELLRELLQKPISQLQILSSHAVAAAAASPAAAVASSPGAPPSPGSAAGGGGGGGGVSSAASPAAPGGGGGASPPQCERDVSLGTLRASEAAYWISTIGVVSKGFAQLPPDSVVLRETFSSATQVALQSMGAFGDAPEVRSKVLMLLHRMVETLGEPLLTYLDSTLPQLVPSSDLKEIVELVTLVNQLVLKFKGKIVQPVTTLFSPLASATFAHLASLEASIASSSSAGVSAAGPASEPVRERRGLLRCFYSLLHSLVHSDLVSVLAAPHNSAHTAPALNALLAGCVEGPDLTLQRQCFAILQRLVEVWIGQLPGFDTFVLQQVLPVCFSAPAQPHFSLKDAAALPLLESSASLQRAILSKLGADLISYMRDRLLPSLGCSAEFCAEYVRHLCDGDVRTLRDFLRAQLVSARS